MYVCNCHGVTEAQARDMARSSCFTYAKFTKLSKCCGGKCLPRIKELINEENDKKKEYSPTHYGGGID